MSAKIIIIAAVDKVGAIGYRNRLLYHLSADLRRFKELTTGHTIVMGRRTFESLPKGALPHRRNIVLTTHVKTYQGVETYSSLHEALKKCADSDKIFIIGGESIYRQAIGIADKLCLTEVHTTAPTADAYFPKLDQSVWREESRESHYSDEKNDYAYDFVDYVRK